MSEATIEQRAAQIRTALANFANYANQMRYPLADFISNDPALDNLMGGHVRFTVSKFGGQFVYEIGLVQIEDGLVFNAQSLDTLDDKVLVALYPLLPTFVTEYTTVMAGALSACESESQRLLDDAQFQPVETSFIDALQGFNGLI